MTAVLMGAWVVLSITIFQGVSNRRQWSVAIDYRFDAVMAGGLDGSVAAMFSNCNRAIAFNFSDHPLAQPALATDSRSPSRATAGAGGGSGVARLPAIIMSLRRYRRGRSSGQVVRVDGPQVARVVGPEGKRLPRLRPDQGAVSVGSGRCW